MADEKKDGAPHLRVYWKQEVHENTKTGECIVKPPEIRRAEVCRCAGKEGTTITSVERVRPASTSASTGATSDSYRDGWDRVFGPVRSPAVGPN